MSARRAGLIVLTVVLVALAGCTTGDLGTGAGSNDEAAPSTTTIPPTQTDSTQDHATSTDRNQETAETDTRTTPTDWKPESGSYAGRIEVVSVAATVTDDEEIGAVNVTVKPDSGTVDLSETAIQWVGPDSTHTFDPPAVDGNGARYGVQRLVVSDGPVTLLNSTDNYVILSFDLGDDDGIAGATPFGSHLGPGDQAQLVFATGEQTTSERLVVPDSLARKDAVNL